MPDGRDLVGYGADPPDPRWPEGKRVALSLVLNYEEGGENTPLEGDPASEAYLHEVIGAPATVGRRNLNTESMFEFGSRVGFWRVHRLVTSFGLPLTVFAVGRALEQNPAAARAMVEAGWEVASHGWRWIDYGELSEDEERDHFRRSVEAIERVCGVRPVGWYTGRGTEATRRLVVEAGGFLYDSDAYADELPYWVEAAGQPHLVVPYTLDANDFKFLLPNGFVTADGLLDVPDRLARRAPRRGRPADVGRSPLPDRRSPREDRRSPAIPRARRGLRRRLGRDPGRDRPALAGRASTAGRRMRRSTNASPQRRGDTIAAHPDRREPTLATAPATWSREALAAAPQTYFDAVDAMDVDGVLAHFADDATLTVQTDHVTFDGADEIRRMFTDFFAASKTIRHEIRNIVVEEAAGKVSTEQGYIGELQDGSLNDMHNCNFFDFDADGKFKRVIIWMAGTNPLH